jgi:hypothetical protein
VGDTGSDATDETANPNEGDTDVIFVKEAFAILLADTVPERPSVPSSLPPVTTLFAIPLVIVPIILFINSLL